MSDNKKPRAMTPKGFLFKTTTKAAASASAFLAQYREYLESSELAPITSLILKKMDDGKIMPTPALQEIQNAVMFHIIAKDVAKVEDKIEHADDPQTKKNWLATIYDADGNICTRKKENGDIEDLQKSYDDSSSADRWCDRRLFDGASDWYAIVEHLPTKTQIRIERNDSMARVLKKNKDPVFQKKSLTTSRLGFGVKVKESKATFSRG